MLDVLHIFMQDEYKFANSLIYMLNEEPCFKSTKQMFIVQTDRAYQNIVRYSNVVLDKRDLKYVLKEYGDKTKWIIIHSLNYNPVRLILAYKKKYARKTIWRTWGHDVFIPVYRNKEFLKNTIKRIIHTLYVHKVRQFRCIGVGNACDEVRCQDVFGQINTVTLNYSHMKGRGVLLKQCYEDKIKHPNSTVKIMVGHSGFPSDRQIELLEQLTKYADDDFIISLVLSYGHSDYIQEVKDFAYTHFKGKVEILDKVIPYEEYLRYLSTVDIALMDQLHSAALGNISVLLFYGTKMYLNRDGVMAKAFQREGVPFYYSYDIGRVDFERFANIDDNISSERYSSLAMSEDDALPVKRWDLFIKKLLE